MNSNTNKYDKIIHIINKTKSIVNRNIYLKAAIYTIVLSVIHLSIVHDESVRNLNKLIAILISDGIILGLIIAAPFSADNIHSINSNLVVIGALAWVYFVILFILKKLNKKRNKSNNIEEK